MLKYQSFRSLQSQGFSRESEGRRFTSRAFTSKPQDLLLIRKIDLRMKSRKRKIGYSQFFLEKAANIGPLAFTYVIRHLKVTIFFEGAKIVDLCSDIFHYK